MVGQPLRLAAEDVDEGRGGVVDDDVDEAGVLEELAVLLGLDDVVAGLLDVVLELGRGRASCPGRSR